MNDAKNVFIADENSHLQKISYCTDQSRMYACYLLRMHFSSLILPKSSELRIIVLLIQIRWTKLRKSRMLPKIPLLGRQEAGS